MVWLLQLLYPMNSIYFLNEEFSENYEIIHVKGENVRRIQK